MRPLTDLQREALVRRIEREYWWSRAGASDRSYAHDLAKRLVEGLEWTGVHGASEKRAIELVVTRIEEEATA